MADKKTSDQTFSARRASRNASLLMFRTVITIIVGLITSRITFNALGVDNYGLNALVGGLLPAFTFIAGILAAATSRFLTFEIGKGDEVAIRETFTATFYAHLILAVILVVVCEVGGLYLLHHKLNIPDEKMGVSILVLQLSILGVFLRTTQSPYDAVIVARERFSIYAYIAMASTFISLLIAFCVKYTTMDKLGTYAVLGALSNLGLILFTRFYCLRHFKESHLLRRVSFIRLKPIMIYVAWELFGNLCFAIYNQSRNYLVNVFFGLRYNASTSIATTVSGSAEGFSIPVQNAFAPSITKQYAQGNLSEMQRAMKTVLLFSSVVFAMIAVPVAFNAEILFQLWLGSVHTLAPEVLRLILLSSFFGINASVFARGIHTVGKMQLISIVGGLYVLAQFFIIYWLYSTYHTYLHAFIVIAIGGCGEIFQRAAILKKVLPELPQTPLFVIMGKVFLIVLVATLPVFAIEGYITHAFLHLVITSLLYVVSLGSLAYTLLLSKQERHTVREFLQKQLQKFHLRPQHQ